MNEGVKPLRNRKYMKLMFSTGKLQLSKEAVVTNLEERNYHITTYITGMAKLQFLAITIWKIHTKIPKHQVLSKQHQSSLSVRFDGHKLIKVTSMEYP